MDDIAALARVAPATVYAVAGGKHGLLRTLIESWMTAPAIAATLKRIEELDNPDEILRVTAAACRAMREEFGDIIRVMLATAPHDAEVAKELASATATYRKAFLPISRRLLNLGALRPGVSVDHAVDVLWFYFGYWSIFTLHDDNRWTYERAEKWLCDQATRALIGATANAGAKG